MQEKPPVHACALAIKIVSAINAKLHKLRATFKVQSVSWTDVGNLILIVLTPDDAARMVKEFESWMTCLPAKASHAQLNMKTHQIVIQHAYLCNDQDKPMSLAEIERELHDSNGIKKNTMALQPRILVTWNMLEYVTQGPIIVAFHNEMNTTHYKTYGIFFRGQHCFARDYIKTKRII